MAFLHCESSHVFLNGEIEKSQDGESPIEIAAKKDHYDIVITLLQHGAVFSDKMKLRTLGFFDCKNYDVFVIKLIKAINTYYNNKIAQTM